MKCQVSQYVSFICHKMKSYVIIITKFKVYIYIYKVLYELEMKIL